MRHVGSAKPYRTNPARVAAVVLVAVLVAAAHMPLAGRNETASLAPRFAFTMTPIHPIGAPLTHTAYGVHPALRHIVGWMSSVGSSASIGDIDGDGLANDLCMTEPRSYEVFVAPIDGTGARYPGFALPQPPVPVSKESVHPTGCRVADFNEDGLADLMVVYSGWPPTMFLRRDPPDSKLAATAFRSQALVPDAVAWYSVSAVVTDLDGDGHVDIVVSNYFQDGSGVLDPDARQPVELQDSLNRATNGGVKHVLLWKEATTGESPSVRYEEVTPFPADVARAWTLATGAADVDGDGLPELYFANDFGPDAFLYNRSTPGALRFDHLVQNRHPLVPLSKRLGRDSFKGMGVDFGDVNGDGAFDIVVSNIASPWQLVEGHFLWVSTGDPATMANGAVPYAEQSERFGMTRSNWGWDVRFDDFDNDGTLELVQATGFAKGTVNRWPQLHEWAMGNDTLIHNPRTWMTLGPNDDISGQAINSFYTMGSEGRFVDIAGALQMGHPFMTRGIATGDVDGDGRLDMVWANQWQDSLYFHNDAPRAGAYVGLHIMRPIAGGTPAATRIRAGHPMGRGDGYPAIGAIARLRLADGRVLIRQVDSGSGHTGARAAEVHFGLGAVAADTPLDIELSWRDAGGRMHRDRVTARPGWHTVLLGGA